MEAVSGLQETGCQRSNKCTQVNAEVIERETSISPHIAWCIKLAHDAGRIRLDATGTNSDQNQTNCQPHIGRKNSQCDVAKHDHHGCIEQHALATEQAVCEPGTQDGCEINATTVGTHDAGGDLDVDTQATLGHGVEHVQEQDALHAVEGEALPHLHTKDGGELTRLTEESLHWLICRCCRHRATYS